MNSTPQRTDADQPTGNPESNIETNISQTNVPAPEPEGAELTGSCFIIGTPIDEQDDFTQRGVRAMQSADIVVSLDERRTARLLKRFAISKPLMGIDDEIAEDVTEAILLRLQKGDRVVIMTDSVEVLGEPIRYLANNIRVAGLEPRVIPGVDMAAMALIMSGFPAERYTVAGYMPARREPREEFIRSLLRCSDTALLFASAPRLTSVLIALTQFMPRREAAVILKPTVPGEAVLRGSVDELRIRLASRMLTGNVAIVLAPLNSVEYGTQETNWGRTEIHTPNEVNDLASEGIHTPNEVNDLASEGIHTANEETEFGSEAMQDTNEEKITDVTTEKNEEIGDVIDMITEEEKNEEPAQQPEIHPDGHPTEQPPTTNRTEDYA